MPPGDLPQFGALLRQERERAGLSLRQLAETAGLIPPTISRLESGLIASPKPMHMQRLASALGIDVEEFYAASGLFHAGGLPELRPYLRTKYGLTEADTRQVEGYVQALRDAEKQTRREVRHDQSGDHNQDP